MAASYPSSVASLSDMGSTLAGPPTHASVHDAANAEIEAIEAELGTSPKGAYATVKARLDKMAHGILSNEQISPGSGIAAGGSYLSDGRTVALTAGRTVRAQLIVEVSCTAAATADIVLEISGALSHKRSVRFETSVAARQLIVVTFCEAVATTGSHTFKGAVYGGVGSVFVANVPAIEYPSGSYTHKSYLLVEDMGVLS